MNQVIQLGKRLGATAKLITQAQESNRYDHIWDCCCDHGYLGIYLLDHFSRHSHHKVQINFVDQVTHITEQLGRQLKKTPLTAYQIHTLNAEHLEFDKRKSHCIIIAGVTTTGTIKILQAILNKHPNQDLDFILCPTRGQYDLRQYLISQKSHLIEEAYIKENSRHYELLFVRHLTNKGKDGYKRVTSIGEFWQTGNEEHLSYLKSRIKHYQQEALDASKQDPNKAIELYSDMFQCLTQQNNK